MPFRPLDHSSELHVHRQKLPHWRQWGVTYFVTSRLADSVPAIIADEWRFKREAWLRAHRINSTSELPQLTDEERQEYRREFTAKFH